MKKIREYLWMILITSLLLTGCIGESPQVVGDNISKYGVFLQGKLPNGSQYSGIYTTSQGKIIVGTVKDIVSSNGIASLESNVENFSGSAESVIMSLKDKGFSPSDFNNFPPEVKALAIFVVQRMSSSFLFLPTTVNSPIKFEEGNCVFSNGTWICEPIKL
jgi:hypothetical protein